MQNFIAKAKNGSGKTLALSIALLQLIPGTTTAPKQEVGEEQKESVSIDGLVLAPTREIAIQLFDYFNLLAKG